MLSSKIATAQWFLARPSTWAHAIALASRKVGRDEDAPELRRQAQRWAAGRVVSARQALETIGLAAPGAPWPALPEELLEEGRRRAEQSSVPMGGPGHLELIHAATALSGAKKAIETGVAYGWSTLAILAGLRDHPGATLVSVDMPYPKRDNDPWVGVAVPDSLRGNWVLIREPDRYGLSKAIRRQGGRIDFAHYDSDKSYWGRMFGYPLIWEALVPGGIFISDDIGDNLAFHDFVERHGLNCCVTESDGKHVGIVRKPSA